MKTKRITASVLFLLLAPIGPRIAGALNLTIPPAGVCNRYCDGRDPALSPTDRQPVSATVWSRRIVLHLDDTDAMGWGSIDNGNPGDHVWLDRSFDGGRSWASGSKLGNTTIPGGQRGWRTLMFNNDDWANLEVG